MRHVFETFFQFCISVFGPIAENEDAESAKSFIKCLAILSAIFTDIYCECQSIISIKVNIKKLKEIRIPTIVGVNIQVSL